MYVYVAAVNNKYVVVCGSDLQGRHSCDGCLSSSIYLNMRVVRDIYCFSIWFARCSVSPKKLHSVLSCVVELLDEDYMSYCIVNCRQIDKNGSYDYTPLVVSLHWASALFGHKACLCIDDVSFNNCIYLNKY